MGRKDEEELVQFAKAHIVGNYSCSCPKGSVGWDMNGNLVSNSYNGESRVDVIGRAMCNRYMDGKKE